MLFVLGGARELGVATNKEKIFSMSQFRSFVRNVVHRAGYDLRRLCNTSELSLCGLTTMEVNTVIDVGANAGQFARYISEYFPSARLFCFEPLPQPFEKLNSWARTQGARVATFNLGIGESNGLVEMNLHTEHTPSSSFLDTTDLTTAYYPQTTQQAVVSVAMATLDSALAEVSESLDKEILIKLDVQGYEDRVLRGGQGIFGKAKACILEVCLDHLYEGQAGFQELVNKLYELDFLYAGNLSQTYADDGHVVYLDAVFKKA